jgi:RNA polymerase sigma factor (sigma-70 family)
MSAEIELTLRGMEAPLAGRNDAMRRVQGEGLEAQFERLLDEFGPGLSRMAASYEVLPQAREDLLQDVRLAIWRALTNFRGECSWRTFVYRIAHNRCLTHIWRRRTLPQQLEEAASETVDPSADPESSAVRRSQHANLMRAVRRLPLPYRQVVILVLEDLPRAEIAAVLGTSESNVAVRLNRAYKLLRERLGGKA